MKSIYRRARSPPPTRSPARPLARARICLVGGVIDSRVDSERGRRCRELAGLMAADRALRVTRGRRRRRRRGLIYAARCRSLRSAPGRTGARPPATPLALRVSLATGCSLPSLALTAPQNMTLREPRKRCDNWVRAPTAAGFATLACQLGRIQSLFGGEFLGADCSDRWFSLVSPINTSECRRSPLTNEPRTARYLSFLILVRSSPLTHTYTNMHYTTTHAGRAGRELRACPGWGGAPLVEIPGEGKTTQVDGRSAPDLAIQRRKITATSR